MLPALLLASLMSLACVAVVHAADPAPGAPPISSGSSSGSPIEDAAITAKVKAALIEDKQVSGLKINVTTEQGVVRISGAVPSSDVGQRALELAAGVKGVRDVKSELTIKAAS